MPFNYRSTNTTGYTHHEGALVIGTGQESGIELNPTSSGANANIMPAGDETNKSITIRGKGTGGVAIGSSGSNISEQRAFTVQFTPPALSSGLGAGAESTYTVTGVSTGTVLIFTPTNPIGDHYVVRPRCSTANELVLAWGNLRHGSTYGSGEASTNRGVLLQFRF